MTLVQLGVVLDPLLLRLGEARGKTGIDRDDGVLIPKLEVMHAKTTWGLAVGCR